MAVSCDLLKSYAINHLPVFNFAFGEAIFPVTVESWLEHCEGGWTKTTDPHRGTAVVTAPMRMTEQNLHAVEGCAAAPRKAIDQTKPLPTAGPDNQLFIDFAGWSSLTRNQGLVQGDDSHIRDLYSSYFAKFSAAQSAGGALPSGQPDKVRIICEGAWAGDFTRDAIANGALDFAPGITNNPKESIPDPWLDQFFVLTYYLFYPASEPAPGASKTAPSSPNRFTREGQWEAVSFYFQSQGKDPPRNATDIILSEDPNQAQQPAYASYSLGITTSGDGRAPSGLAQNYFAQAFIFTPAVPGYTEGGLQGPNPVIPPPQVWVTQGTHKNWGGPSDMPPPGASPSDWTHAAGIVSNEGSTASEVGNALLGASVGAVISAFFDVIVLLLLLAALLDQAFGQPPSGPPPDPEGDAAGGGATASPGNSPPQPSPSGFNTLSIDLQVISQLPDNQGCAPAPWWTFPGNWGVAVTSDKDAWDSGGRLSDYRGRTRAYWNTVWLQAAHSNGTLTTTAEPGPVGS